MNAENAKLVTLGAGAKNWGEAGGRAAVRDDTGRTYTGATVDLPSLELTAVQAAVAQAAGAGARGVEAVVVVCDVPVVEEASLTCVGISVAPECSTSCATRQVTLSRKSPRDPYSRFRLPGGSTQRG